MGYREVVRAIDFLETRDDIDVSRLGLVGFSLGAHIGWIATAIDSRIDKSVIMAMPFLVVADGQAYSFTSPGLYVEGMRKQSIALIAAREDHFYSMDQVTKLYSKIGSDKKSVVWVDGGHDLPRSTASVTSAFFKEDF